MSEEHTLKLIRDEIVRRLTQSEEVDGETKWPTPALDRVWPGWEVPLGHDEHPAILIYDDDEHAEGEVEQGRPWRVVTMVIECRVVGETAVDVDDQLLQMALAVELAVMADPYQGGNARSTTYVGTVKERNADGEEYTGAAGITYNIMYDLDPARLPLADDFRIFSADYDLQPTNGIPEAADLVELPGPED